MAISGLSPTSLYPQQQNYGALPSSGSGSNSTADALDGLDRENKIETALKQIDKKKFNDLLQVAKT
ncbi:MULTISPECIES: hypothetical protein [unclassified Pseudomonas]|jgi:hypothetical protein|uniref:hypothetical protein n=1 Tax=unclassified Pseudomonas TaxID=196821 RepID=UPI00103A7CF9|nr:MULTISPECIES: hypothetical protein [unclassified Pseudomonas]MBB6288803.1 hypothetical protein [Pseudomonas sp. SJZ073]MBB6313775.1 hypothetical protein [Pseudomonas sp. JAI120]MCS4309795.1 hypothetical protein [Pseudomonas sp. BIGb0381]